MHRPTAGLAASTASSTAAARPWTRASNSRRGDGAVGHQQERAVAVGERGERRAGTPVDGGRHRPSLAGARRDLGDDRPDDAVVCGQHRRVASLRQQPDHRPVPQAGDHRMPRVQLGTIGERIVRLCAGRQPDRRHAEHDALGRGGLRGGASGQHAVTDLDRGLDAHGLPGADRLAVDDHRVPAGDLHERDAPVRGDRHDGVVRLDGGVVEAHQRPLDTTEHVATGWEGQATARVGAGDHGEGRGHAAMWTVGARGRNELAELAPSWGCEPPGGAHQAPVKVPVRGVGHGRSMTTSRVDLIGHRLRREWERLRGDPPSLRAAAAWGLLPDPPTDLDQVLTAIGFGRPSTPACDIALARLVGLAAHDRLAGRVVLQRLLPGLIARAGHRDRIDRGAALDELIGAAWICITTYDARRSPGCLAAALVADAEHLAFRKASRRRWTGEIAGALDLDHVAAVDDDPIGELAEVFRLARVAQVDQADLDLLRRLLSADRAEDVAAELRVTARTIRNRRARVTDRLRELATAA